MANVFIPQSHSEKLLYTTVIISSNYENSQSGVGTGSLFSRKYGRDKNLPLVITNKHVVNGSVTSEFILHVANGIGASRAPSGKYAAVEIGPYSDWFGHPNDNIDLSGNPINPTLHQAAQSGDPIFSTNIGDDIIPFIDDIQDLNAV